MRLQEQPYRLLLVLLENPGEVVSREELRNRLWPGDTFVDFDGSLRVAVRKLREALDDNAGDPRYIETIPKRGYRFFASEVRRIDSAHEAAEQSGDALGDGLEPLQTDTSPEAPSQRNKPLFWYVLTAVGLILTAAGVIRWHHREQTKPLTDKDVLVLADFTNTTGDPVFDGTLRQGLAVQLEQSPFLRIISDQRIQETLKMMGQPADARLTSEIAREVCQRSGE